jgi:LDH2 family malate/lactate/ureidoglycolate dehydrogenase
MEKPMQIAIDVLTSQLTAAAETFVSPEEAAYFARCYVRAHLRKSPRMTPIDDAVKDLMVWRDMPGASIDIRLNKPGASVVDCNRLAPSLKIKAIHDALTESASRSGVAAAGLINTAGIITLGMWSDGLADRDMIGLAMFNGGCGCAVPFGARRGLLGTNPLAYGIPTGGEPLTMDGATTEAPYFEIKAAAETGSPLRASVAVDQRGLPTTNAAEAMTEDGVSNLLPIGGGMKGFGIMMLVEALTGALIGSPMSSEQTLGWHPHEYGCFLLAVDIASFSDLDRFKIQMDGMTERIRGMTPAEGADRVRVPGDRANAREAEAWRIGEIDVAEETLKQLDGLSG